MFSWLYLLPVGLSPLNSNFLRKINLQGFLYFIFLRLSVSSLDKMTLLILGNVHEKFLGEIYLHILRSDAELNCIRCFCFRYCCVHHNSNLFNDWNIPLFCYNNYWQKNVKKLVKSRLFFNSLAL